MVIDEQLHRFRSEIESIEAKLAALNTAMNLHEIAIEPLQLATIRPHRPGNRSRMRIRLILANMLRQLLHLAVQATKAPPRHLAVIRAFLFAGAEKYRKVVSVAGYRISLPFLSFCSAASGIGGVIGLSPGISFFRQALTCGGQYGCSGTVPTAWGLAVGSLAGFAITGADGERAPGLVGMMSICWACTPTGLCLLYITLPFGPIHFHMSSACAPVAASTSTSSTRGITLNRVSLNTANLQLKRPRRSL